MEESINSKEMFIYDINNLNPDMRKASIMQLLVSGQDDLAWFESNLDRLKAEYNNRFIAFHDSKVIDSDTDVNRLIKRLESNDIDTSDVFIKFVSRVKAIL